MEEDLEDDRRNPSSKPNLDFKEEDRDGGCWNWPSTEIAAAEEDPFDDLADADRRGGWNESLTSMTTGLDDGVVVAVEGFGGRLEEVDDDAIAEALGTAEAVSQ